MRRRRGLLGLVGATALLGMGGTAPGARAQDAPVPGEQLFGIYELEARGVGVEGRYEIQGLIPGDLPVLDLTMPETLARFGSGPTGYGLASLAYPGGIFVNLPSLVDQSGGDGSQIPPYPIKAEAFFPAGPTEVDESQPGGVAQRVSSGPLGVEAAGAFPAIAADPAVSVGSIRSVARTAVEGAQAVSRARVELGDVSILGGVIGIDSIVTDLVAVHDGERGGTDGRTVASGVTFLGLAASLTDEGFFLEEAPPVAGPGEPLGGVLDPAAGPLADASAPVREAVAGVLAQATPQLDDLLAQAGVRIELLEPNDVEVDSGASSRASSGVSVTFSYLGREQAQLVDLINSVPDELKPNVGPIPNPVTFLAENHLYGLHLAPASVSTLASPPFDLTPLPDVPLPASDLGGTGTGGFAAPGFATPTPALPPSSTGTGDASGAVEVASVLFDGAVPALLVLLTLLAAPLFGVGSTKLADNVLAPVSTSCPTGHDQPPGRPT